MLRRPPLLLSALCLALLGEGCPRPAPVVAPPAEEPPPPPPPVISPEEEPFSPVPGPARALGSPPFRLALVTDPGDRPRRVAELLRLNLERSGAFVLDGASPPVATLRVGPRAAMLYLPHGVPGGPFERSFPLDGASRGAAATARALASALHSFYLNEPGLYFTRIAFISGTGADSRARHVFTVGFDGTGVRRVSGEDHPNLLPAWSRAGDLVYTAFVGGAPALVLRPAGGGAAQVLARQRDLNTGAAFSPDGRTIAVSQSVDGNTDVYLLDRRGNVTRRLTRHAGIDISPTWSPAGDEIAFISDREGSPQVWLASLRDGSFRRLTSDGFYNQEPDWCPLPGSREIVYTHRYSGSRYEVHLLDADTGRSLRLTQDDGQNTGPSWSPDCRWILYAAKGRGLWAITTDGRARRQLYAGAARSPAWSPRLAPHLF